MKITKKAVSTSLFAILIIAGCGNIETIPQQESTPTATLSPSVPLLPIVTASKTGFTEVPDISDELLIEEPKDNEKLSYYQLLYWLAKQNGFQQTFETDAEYFKVLDQYVLDHKIEIKQIKSNDNSEYATLLWRNIPGGEGSAVYWFADPNGQLSPRPDFPVSGNSKLIEIPLPSIWHSPHLQFDKAGNIFLFAVIESIPTAWLNISNTAQTVSPWESISPNLPPLRYKNIANVFNGSTPVFNIVDGLPVADDIYWRATYNPDADDWTVEPRPHTGFDQQLRQDVGNNYAKAHGYSDWNDFYIEYSKENCCESYGFGSNDDFGYLLPHGEVETLFLGEVRVSTKGHTYLIDDGIDAAIIWYFIIPGTSSGPVPILAGFEHKGGKQYIFQQKDYSNQYFYASWNVNLVHIPYENYIDSAVFKYWKKYLQNRSIYLYRMAYYYVQPNPSSLEAELRLQDVINLADTNPGGDLGLIKMIGYRD